jgi:putative flippase GtrA
VITRRRLGELARFGSTGAFCAALNVVVAVLLTQYAGLHYLVGQAIGAGAVIVAGFFLNRSWTFRKRGSAAVLEFLRYGLVTVANVIIGLLSCAFLVEEVGIPYAYAIAIVAIVFAPINYLVHRVWSFGLSWLHGE